MPQDERRIEILADWLVETMRRKGLSAAGWARLAGHADTTISRFLKQRRHLLRKETIDNLAAAAGVDPPDLDREPAETFPLVDASARLHALMAQRQRVWSELQQLDEMIAAQIREIQEAHRLQTFAPESKAHNPAAESDPSRPVGSRPRGEKEAPSMHPSATALVPQRRAERAEGAGAGAVV
jgi:transcriptional regulator with XRE-family HTH domain